MLTKEHKKELLQKISFIDDLNKVIQNYIRHDLEFSYLVLYNKNTDIVKEYIISKNKYGIIVDAKPCHINSLKGNLIELANVVMIRTYDTNANDVAEMLENNDWEVVENTISYCPYCGSPNIETIDNMEDSNKYKCYNCNEDFILWNDGEITDRHNRLIQIKEN